MIKPILSFTIPFLQAIIGCQSPQSQPELAAVVVSRQVETTDGTTISQRFQPPAGYQRTEAPANSFALYLRNLPLKPADAPVYLFDGRLKSNQSAHAAVVDMDTGNRDLQQCADAVMRLRAEYLFAQKQYADLHFNFTNGFKAEYAKWRHGQRVKVEGNRCEWFSTNLLSTSYESFREYLDLVFMYAASNAKKRSLRCKRHSSNQTHGFQSGQICTQCER